MQLFHAFLYCLDVFKAELDILVPEQQTEILCEDHLSPTPPSPPAFTRLSYHSLASTSLPHSACTHTYSHTRTQRLCSNSRLWLRLLVCVCVCVFIHAGGVY